ncbi:aldo/keto reductase [Cellulomonas fimi]|uniref:Aldo/keto reductase n=1 Tax=Cellulomonas fimi (strain ATCC 484 / DSM 20113 / JCM 1341 / CCUG 24087 / LMG 16345 / NBRC 15513 / NCIMB 8980 / NCTC 7547 / NRS-133) TaxID=590998 RepID=F4H0W4_CELFA|nr:aldo/keto reductase [Cellulomonas fimi]AEE46211.1 aldo/keto reductase [Cellulomonas fimi ATCC 484]NNH08580.1 aldo/keto reductase [Cellulomonas fimi]VEH32074.1 General stress protein 69 [Cellulomonas fimi]
MEYRPLGRTGLTVSEIGYGAWGIGASQWVGAREDESVAALHRAIELGVNLVDTARGYGESERIVGRVLRDHPDVHVATKVPPKNGVWPAPAGLHPDETFPGSHIRQSLETSLAASGLEAFDVLQLHVWSDEWVGKGDWLETVDDLRREGKIRFFGVSVNDYQPQNVLALVRSGTVDTVQVIANVWHQEPQEQLLPACAEHGVGVIVRVALDEGGLTGRITAASTFPEGDFRNTYFGGDRPAQVEEHVAALVRDLGIDTDALPDLALRYVLDQPAVSTVIAGMRTVRNVERNAATSDGRRLTPEQHEVVRRHRWERNFYQPAA